jgi:hypothetical protein
MSSHSHLVPPADLQGLDWFQRLMRRDSDGDCASAFLEEACRQQQQQPKQQKKKQSAQRSRDRPAAKQQKAAVLQVGHCTAAATAMQLPISPACFNNRG